MSPVVLPGFVVNRAALKTLKQIEFLGTANDD